MNELYIKMNHILKMNYILKVKRKLNIKILRQIQIVKIMDDGCFYNYSVKNKISLGYYPCHKAQDHNKKILGCGLYSVKGFKSTRI